MTARKESQRQVIEFYWNKGIRSAKEICKRTGIASSTVYDNIKKLKKTGTTKRLSGNVQPRKMSNSALHHLRKYIHQDSSLSTRTVATKLSQTGVDVSHSTVGRHLANMGYVKNHPAATPMLTTAHKEKRVEWANKHLNDNWGRTLFTDETAFQLFRNTVERWHKKGKRPIRRIPKDRTKIFAWGGFYKNGKTSLFCFSQIMDAKFYVNILRDHIPEVKKILGNRWHFQQDNVPKHTIHLTKEFLAENVPQFMD